MPTVKPISELQRNISAIAKECRETKEPIYLTKNGSASLVVLDAETYDREMAVHRAVQDREMRVRNAIMRGWEDAEAGRTRSLEDAKADLAAIRKARSERER